MNEENNYMNISAITVMETQKLLDYLVENGEILAQIGDLTMKYKGIHEDTISGKRQIFYIERKINE